MSHTRFELGFSRHKKIRRLSDAAFRLWVCAMDIAREQCSDGALDADDLDLIPKLTPNAKRRLELVAELVENGLWDVRGNGWQIHDFLDWQDSREVIENKRAAARERMRSVRANRAGTGKQTSPEVPPTLGSGEKREERRQQPEPPSGGGRSGDVPCPPDLALSPDQRASLETSLIPGWAIDVVTAKFRAQWVGSEDSPRSLGQWCRSLVSAVTAAWNDPRQRPRRPEPEAPPPKPERTPTFEEVCR